MLYLNKLGCLPQLAISLITTYEAKVCLHRMHSTISMVGSCVDFKQLAGTNTPAYFDSFRGKLKKNFNKEMHLLVLELDPDG